MKRVLVVGQTPPPYGGQAMMINRLTRGAYTLISIVHVRMSFSDSFMIVGKAGLRKLLHMFGLVWKIWLAKIEFNPAIFYYPPAGPNFMPIIRDISILLLTRPLFRKTVFHFHAAGISDYLLKAPFLLRLLARCAYSKPDVAIQPSGLNPRDGDYFGAKKISIIPNGLADEALPYMPIHREKRRSIGVLFVGVLRKDKGVMTLLRAATLLRQEISNAKFTFIGQFSSAEFEHEVKNYVKLHQLELSVQFVGTRVGNEKWEYFLNSDIFCYPTYFDSESFGTVLLEAMMFELPIVATQWRGIPDIVKQDTGFLVPIRDEFALSEKIRELIGSPTRRINIGKAGRRRFLEKYSLEKHLEKMEKVLSEV